MALTSMIISHLNKTKLSAVVLVISVVLLKTVDASMCGVINLPLGSLSHGIHFRQATIQFNSLASFKRKLTSMDMSSVLYVKLITLGVEIEVEIKYI